MGLVGISRKTKIKNIHLLKSAGCYLEVLCNTAPHKYCQIDPCLLQTYPIIQIWCQSLGFLPSELRSSVAGWWGSSSMKGATHQRTHDLVTGRKIKTNNNITNG